MIDEISRLTSVDFYDTASTGGRLRMVRRLYQIFLYPSISAFSRPTEKS